VTKFVNCKDNENCSDCGVAKLTSEEISSKRKARVKFSNNNKSFEMQFVSPKKVALEIGSGKEKPISGMVNLACNSELKMVNQIIVAKNVVRIVNETALQQEIEGNAEAI
jgi:hypothetical protein